MAVEKGDADMISFWYSYTDGTLFDTTAYNHLFENYFDSLGYNANYAVNTTVADALTRLKSRDIFVYSGHGDRAVLVFETTGRTITGKIFAHYDSYLHNKTYPYSVCHISENPPSNLLARERCVLYLACNTGVSTADGYNLVDSTYEEGAHYVLGTTQETDVDSDDIWLANFLAALNNGKNISAAKTDANEAYRDYLENHYRVVQDYPLYDRGDDSQYLN